MWHSQVSSSLVSKATSELDVLLEVWRTHPLDVVSIFPNQAACLRLVSAILMEQDEEWQTGRTYLSSETSP